MADKKTDETKTSERVVDYTVEQIKKMNLFEKMLHVEAGVGVVGKNLEVGYGKTAYKAVSEADVKRSVSPLEQKFRVKSIPIDIEIVDSGIIAGTRASGKEFEDLWLRVKSTVVFINIDNPEERITVTAFGDGIDGGDKAPGKGDTYSVKYCYLKAYKIVTGDDPDREASEDGTKTRGKKPTPTPTPPKPPFKKADVKPQPKNTNSKTQTPSPKPTPTPPNPKPSSAPKPATDGVPKPTPKPKPTPSPKPSPKASKSDDKVTPAQLKLLEKLKEDGNILPEQEFDGLDKGLASKLISEAKTVDVEAGEYAYIDDDGKVLVSDLPF